MDDNEPRTQSFQTAFHLCVSLGLCLWSVLKRLVFFLWFAFLCLFLLRCLVLGVALSFYLPESFFYERIFLWLSSIWILILSILYISLIVKAKKLDQKQNAKPLQRYLGMRLRASRYMEKMMESSHTWIQELTNLIQKSIVHNLDGCKDQEAQNLQEASVMMKTLHKDLFGSGNTPAQNQMIKKAVCFTLKEKTMKNVADLQGKRRCYILVGLLSEITDPSDSFLPSCSGFQKSLYGCMISLRSCLTSCSCFKKIFYSCLQCIKALSSCLPSCSCFQTVFCCCLQCLKPLSSCIPSWCRVYSGKKYSFKSILMAIIMCLITVIIFVYDIVTDGEVVILYWNLWSSSGNRSLSSIITGRAYGDGFFGTEIFIPVAFLTMCLGLSMILTILSNPLKKLARQFKIILKMNNPYVEKNCEMLPPSSLVQRYDLPIEESGLESPLECIWQMGLFLALVPLDDVLQVLEPHNPIVAAYDDKLKFVENFLPSFVSSVVAITMGQVRRNSVFQEFNISWKQWVIYFLASLWSTMTFLVGFIIIISSGIGVAYTSINRSVVYSFIIGTCILLSTGPFVTRLTRSKEDRRKLPASRLSWLTSTFTTLLLPTSQHITRGRYNIYHSSLMESPQLLRRAAEQCGAYLVGAIYLLSATCFHYFGWAKMPVNGTYVNNTLSLINSTVADILDIPRYQMTNITYLLPQSAISATRRNIMIANLVMVPAGLILSYIFLAAYFYMDNGFYGITNVEYYFNNDNKINEAEDDEVGEGSGENFELNLVNAAEDSTSGEEEPNCNDTTPDDSEDQTEQENLETTGENSTEYFIQNWIDRDVEEDWYTWTNLSSCISRKNAKPIEQWNMAGSWIDLTGDDGLEGDCDDGDAVLNGAEGSLEYYIKMSFPYYRNENTGNVFSCCRCCNRLVTCCCSCCHRNELSETVVETGDQSRSSAQQESWKHKMRSEFSSGVPLL